MKEMLESLTETIKERFKSPFFGTFIIVWIVINWRLLLFLALSNDPIAVRIHVAEVCYIDNLLVFWYPISITLIYLIAPSYIMLFVDWMNLNGIKAKKDLSFEIVKHDQTLKMSKATMDIELEDKIAKNRDRSSFLTEIHLLKTQVTEREKNIENLKLELDRVVKSNDEYIKKLSKNQFAEKMGKHGYTIKVNFNGKKRPPELDIFGLTKEAYNSKIQVYGVTGGDDAIEGTINFFINDNSILPTHYANFLIERFGFTVLEIS